MNVGGRSLKGSYEGITAIAMCFFAFVGLIYGWVWWFRIGRRQSAPHTGRPGATLVYSTLLPFAFMFFYPMCSIPEREVLTYSMSGMPLVLIALLLAFWVPRNVRWLFSVYPLLWFGWVCRLAATSFLRHIQNSCTASLRASAHLAIACFHVRLCACSRSFGMRRRISVSTAIAPGPRMRISSAANQ